MNSERRLLERYPVRIKAVVITPSASIPVHTVDISTSGIRIRSPEPVLPETHVALSLATKEETLLSGRTQWALEKKHKDGTLFYEVGIEADAFILKDREAIGITDKEAAVLEILNRIQNTETRGK